MASSFLFSFVSFAQRLLRRPLLAPGSTGSLVKLHERPVASAASAAADGEPSHTSGAQPCGPLQGVEVAQPKFVGQAVVTHRRPGRGPSKKPATTSRAGSASFETRL